VTERPARPRPMPTWGFAPPGSGQTRGSRADRWFVQPRCSSSPRWRRASISLSHGGANRSWTATTTIIGARRIAAGLGLLRRSQRARDLGLAPLCHYPVRIQRLSRRVLSPIRRGPGGRRCGQCAPSAPLLCLPGSLCQRFQRILLAADDRALASDSPRSVHRIPESHQSVVWDPLWDFLFCASSLLLAVFFGAALGNVVRGVPLDSSGLFLRAAVDPISGSEMKPESSTGIRSWWEYWRCSRWIMHGALWVRMKTSGEVHAPCGKTREPRVVGRRGAYGAGYGFHIPQFSRKSKRISRTGRGASFSPAGRGGDSRRPL